MEGWRSPTLPVVNCTPCLVSHYNASHLSWPPAFSSWYPSFHSSLCPEPFSTTTERQANVGSCPKAHLHPRRIVSKVSCQTPWELAPHRWHCHPVPHLSSFWQVKLVKLSLGYKQMLSSEWDYPCQALSQHSWSASLASTHITWGFRGLILSDNSLRCHALTPCP